MRYYGVIGYATTKNIGSGEWKEVITEHHYYGDILRNSRRLQQSSEKINDDINISNQISIIADPYAYSNFHNIRYCEFMGIKWKITDVEVQYPRLILTLGGQYNAQT